MKPPSRERKSRNIMDISGAIGGVSGYWNRDEKRQLLQALKRYDSNDIEKLTKCIPTRSAQEITWAIRKYSMRPGPGQYVKGISEPAPINSWINLIRELISELEDYSHLLAQVTSVISIFEPHKAPISDLEPNYKNIYQYLVSLLQGSADNSMLSHIDAAVVLDLIQSLAEELKTSDMTEQKLVMLEKYKLLTTPITTETRLEAYKARQQALNMEPIGQCNSLCKDQEVFLKHGEGEISDLGKHNKKADLENSFPSTSGESDVRKSYIQDSVPGTSTTNAKSDFERDTQTDVENPVPSTSADNIILSRDIKTDSAKKCRGKQPANPHDKDRDWFGRPITSNLFTLNPLVVPVSLLKPKKASLP